MTKCYLLYQTTPHLLDCKESPSFDASFDLCLASILAFLMALFFSRELIDEELIAAISAFTTSAALYKINYSIIVISVSRLKQWLHNFLKKLLHHQRGAGGGGVNYMHSHPQAGNARNSRKNSQEIQ